MKKVIMFLLLAVIAVGVMSCKESKPAKTAAELKADSIAKAKKDSVKSIADFKKESISIIERYIKRNISSDPDYGKVLETTDKILNDSMYFALSRIVLKNKYGAVEQYSDIWFLFCRRDKKDPRFIFWPKRDFCQSGIDFMLGHKDSFISDDIFILSENDYHKLMDGLCNDRYATVKERLR